VRLLRTAVKISARLWWRPKLERLLRSHEELSNTTPYNAQVRYHPTYVVSIAGFAIRNLGQRSDVENTTKPAANACDHEHPQKRRRIDTPSYEECGDSHKQS